MHVKRNIFSALVLVLVFAGGALASPYCGGPYGVHGYGDMGPRHNDRREMTPEMRSQFETMRKLREDLRTELAKPSPDKAKARSIHEKILDIKQDIEERRFSDMCAKPKAFAGMDDLKKIPAEQRAKIEEVRRLRGDIMTEMRKDSPDKAKAQALHARVQKLTREIESARFEEILKDPAKYAAREQRRGFMASNSADIKELRNIEDEIRAELRKDAPDKAKVRSLSKKAQSIRNKLDDARVEEMLKDPQKFKDCAGFGPGCGGNGPRID